MPVIGRRNEARFCRCLFESGNVLKEEGEVEEAIASYRKAIEVKPDFANALSAQPQCLMEAGRVVSRWLSMRSARN